MANKDWALTEKEIEQVGADHHLTGFDLLPPHSPTMGDVRELRDSFNEVMKPRAKFREGVKAAAYLDLLEAADQLTAALKIVEAATATAWLDGKRKKSKEQKAETVEFFKSKNRTSRFYPLLGAYAATGSQDSLDKLNEVINSFPREYRPQYQAMLDDITNNVLG